MSDFQNIGYTKVENLVDAQTVKTISQYFENRIHRGEWVGNSEVAFGDASKLGYYADPLIEVMLKECQSLIEKHTELLLEPTYSFSRVYQGEEELKPHTDRPSCEISVTINVACTGDIWPIWMQYKNNDPIKCLLNPGDAVIYKGCEVTHWRRKLPEGQINVQFMLHYVERNGLNSEYKFDKRKSLGENSPENRS
tara:strand:+ start:402 stop:986 length:585 start_codon:yes stop_codon:yes gene_type:complete